MLAVVVLAGCGGADRETAWPYGGGRDPGAGNGQAVPNKAKRVSIDFWYTWSGDFRNEFQKTVVDAFVRDHPELEVNMTFLEGTGSTQYSDKILTSIAGGEPPDVLLFDRFLIQSWASKGLLEDLTPYLTEDNVSPADYDPRIWAETVYEGRVYGLPWVIDGRAMYYNKTMMAKAGLDPNRPPRTIDELDRMAERMFAADAEGRYTQVGFIPWMGQGFLYTQAWNWGGRWEDAEGRLTPDDPRNALALEWMAGYANKYDIARLQQFYDKRSSYGINPFVGGNVAFSFDGNWVLNDLRKYEPGFDWGVAPMPSAGEAEQTTWVGGWSLVVPKGAKHVREAWEFIRFAAGREGALLWSKRPNAGSDMTALPAVNEELKLRDDPHLRVFLDMLPQAKVRPVTPLGSLLWNEAMRVQELAVNGRGNPRQLLADVKKQLEEQSAKLGLTQK
ncbi:ABC transporter substrate-binding protein [Paenibacillus flagellatus]|uniref:ABC transporter substrate-binding protein n=1 Tax=Paenibacillus flagellatus TaxID=2211139 RepID=UPI0013052D7C|nr:ABC transporter substrate-binding protein [Paenibacillus flagellatus]